MNNEADKSVVKDLKQKAKTVKAQLNATASEMNRRHKGAAKLATANHARLNRLEEQVKAKSREINSLDLENVATVAYVHERLEATVVFIDSIKETFNKEISRLDDRITEVDGRVTGEINILSTEVYMLKESDKSLNKRVVRIENQSGIVHESGTAVLIKWIIVVLASLIAMIIWSNAEMKEYIEVPYGDPIPFNYQLAQSWLGTGILGIAVGGFVGALLTAIPFGRRTTETTTAYQQSVDEEVNVPIPENPHPATRALPVAAGNGNRGQEG